MCVYIFMYTYIATYTSQSFVVHISRCFNAENVFPR